jgi:large subunit ribosomal protein L13
VSQKEISVAGTKSFMAKPGELTPKWWVVDAADKTVGRLASDIAMVLMGKHQPTYTPHVDTGDFVIVVNCEKVKFSGKKWEQKEYAWFTGYRGLKTVSAEKRRETHPDRILRDAVRRMLPKNESLARKMLGKLKIYSGDKHDHQAQQPQPKELGSK